MKFVDLADITITITITIKQDVRLTCAADCKMMLRSLELSEVEIIGLGWFPLRLLSSDLSHSQCKSNLDLEIEGDQVVSFL